MLKKINQSIAGVPELGDDAKRDSYVRDDDDDFDREELERHREVDRKEFLATIAPLLQLAFEAMTVHERENIAYMRNVTDDASISMEHREALQYLAPSPFSHVFDYQCPGHTEVSSQDRGY